MRFIHLLCKKVKLTNQVWSEGFLFLFFTFRFLIHCNFLIVIFFLAIALAIFFFLHMTWAVLQGFLTMTHRMHSF